MPASAVRVVEPSATVNACQSVPATISPLAPKAIDVPLIVIELFANLAFAIEPAK